jgi:hypothetical protein
LIEVIIVEHAEGLSLFLDKTKAINVQVVHRENNLGDNHASGGFIGITHQRGGLCCGNSKRIWEFYGPLHRGFAQRKFIDW